MVSTVGRGTSLVHTGRDLLPALCGEPGLLLQLWEQSSQGMVLLLVWDGAGRFWPLTSAISTCRCPFPQVP